MRTSAVLLALASLAAAPLVLTAQAPPSAAADIQLQLGDLLARDARFRDAADAYRRARAAAGDDPAVRRRAQAALALMLLRTGDFAAARIEAEQLTHAPGVNAAALAIYGDALWSSGLFEEAEEAYDGALKLDGGDPRAHHGRARALTGHSRLREALIEAREALNASPRDAELHHTLGVILEREHQFDEAAAAFADYVNLLPDRDHSQKALWTRSEIRFLDSFKGRTPVTIAGATRTWTVPVRIDRDKVLVRLKINGGPASDFVLDTGAEQIVLSREVASRRRVAPITYMPAAGVGDSGLRRLP